MKPPNRIPYPLSIAFVLLGCGLVFSLIAFVKGGPSSVLAAIAKSGFTAAFTLIFVSEIGDKVIYYYKLLPRLSVSLFCLHSKLPLLFLLVTNYYFLEAQHTYIGTPGTVNKLNWVGQVHLAQKLDVRWRPNNGFFYFQCSPCKSILGLNCLLHHQLQNHAINSCKPPLCQLLSTHSFLSSPLDSAQATYTVLPKYSSWPLEHLFIQKKKTGGLLSL